LKQVIKTLRIYAQAKAIYLSLGFC